MNDQSTAPGEDVRPAGCGCGGKSEGEGGSAPAHVYALGRIQHRFPSIALEKELAQVVSRTGDAGFTDPEVLHTVLSRPENRYLARRSCWILTIEGLDTYLLVPRDASTLDLLIASLRRAPRPTDIDVVIGARGPIASPDMCAGLQVPIVAVDQLYSFDVGELIDAIPRPESIPEQEFASASEQLFYRIKQMTDNAGATDEHRALNYVALRYSAVYAAVVQAYSRGESLSCVEVRRSRLSGTRKVVDVVFSFTSRATDVTEKMFCRVDVTEEFPFLVTKMSPFYDG